MSVRPVAPPAWEERVEYGFWGALWRTWRGSVLRPVPFFRALPPDGGYGSALSYAVLMTGVGLFFELYWGVLAGLVGRGPGTGEPGALMLVVSAAVAFVFLLVLWIGALFLGAAVIHVGLLAAGDGHQGFEGTFRALAYAAGPSAFAIFPFFGPLAGFVWGLVLVFIGVREVQRTTSGRALIGLLLPLAVVFALLLGFALLVGLLVGRGALA